MKSESEHDNRPTVTIKILSFLPSIFMAELHMLLMPSYLPFSHECLINQFWPLTVSHFTYTRPWEADVPVCCYFILKDRASTIRLLIFSSQTFLLVAWFWALIGLTPVGITFFVEVLERAPMSLKGTTMYSNIHINSAVRFLRSIAYALLMLNRRTTLVTLGTLIRLFGLFAILFILQEPAQLLE